VSIDAVTVTFFAALVAILAIWWRFAPRLGYASPEEIDMDQISRDYPMTQAEAELILADRRRELRERADRHEAIRLFRDMGKGG
jgi:hypothetical protein